jgi:hypothetical protein
MAGPTTESLADDMHELRSEVARFHAEFTEFRGEVRAVIGFAKWLGAFVAAALVGILASVLTLSWHASSAFTRQAATEKSVDRLSSMLGGAATVVDVERLRADVDGLKKRADERE